MRLFISIIAVLCGGGIVAQSPHNIAIGSYTTKLFLQEAYVVPVTLRGMPTIMYQYTLPIRNNWSIILGGELQVVPTVSVYEFNVNDPGLKLPYAWKSREIHRSVWVHNGAISASVQSGFRFKKPEQPHSYQVLLSINSIFPKRAFSGALLTDNASGDFASFTQIYDFQPHGPLALRLQWAYHYHFNLFNHNFFLLSRLDYQLYNVPEVEFNANRIENDDYILISNSRQQFPRWYACLGLGLNFGK
jgi:hypothetical protein